MNAVVVVVCCVRQVISRMRVVACYVRVDSLHVISVLPFNALHVNLTISSPVHLPVLPVVMQ